MVKHVFKKLILPKEITKSIVQKYIRRAIHNKSWFMLPRERRALLKALILAQITVVKNSKLKSLILEAIEFIEKHSVKGKAILYGLIIVFNRFKTRVEPWFLKLETLLYLGINYLSNPSLFRYLDEIGEMAEL